MRRRSFLTSLGATAGFGALAQTGLFRGRARAECGAPPKRLLVVMSSQGNYAPGFRMPFGDIERPTCTEDRDRELRLGDLSEDELSPILQPLWRHRRRVLALDGLTMTSAWANTLALPFNAHNQGCLHALTGGNGRVVDGAVVASAPSLDQTVGAANHREGTRASLNIGIGRINPSTTIAYAPDLSPIRSATNPREIFDTLFGSAPPPRTDVRGSRVASGRARLFRTLDREYAAARDSHALSASDMDRLEAHRALLAGIAAQLDDGTVTCGDVTLPEAPESARYMPDTTVAAYDARIRTWGSMVSAAFASDITRTAVLELGTMSAGHFGGTAGVDVHLESAHGVWGDSPSLPASSPRRRAARTQMTLYNQTHARHVAMLCDALADTPAEDGGSMLDHTLVYWCNELADGGHGFRDFCATLVGGESASGFQMGRYVRFAQNGPRPAAIPNYSWSADDGHQAPWWQCEHGLGPAHNRLLVSIGKVFDAEIDHVGERSIEGRSGEGTIDTTTPLSVLTRAAS